MITDALGNMIVFGNYYGYSRSQNGHNTIHVGKALHETKKGMLSLEVEHTKTGCYESATTSEVPHRHVTVKPILIFPVDINTVSEL